jgi:hypothetical protein
MKPAKVYRAIKAYTPKNQEPLILKKGDFVRVERDSTYRCCDRFCAKLRPAKIVVIMSVTISVRGLS